MNGQPPYLVLFQDLIQSEKAYIDDLLTIISRIAAAYTPIDFPPMHLDHHFRLIESIFRFHKIFEQEPMPNPQQRTMGSLIHLFGSLVQRLMPVYARYCHPTGWAGRGGWSRDRQVNSNPTLIQTLHNLPWPRSLDPPSQNYYSPFPDAPYPKDDIILYDSNSQPHASLTVFFCLPFTRLVYYKRLSLHLLQLIPPHSPQHKTVYDCSHQLSFLLDRGRAQWNISPLQIIQPPIHQQFTQNQLQPIRQHPPDHQPPSQSHSPPPPPPLKPLITTTQPCPPRYFSPVQALPSQPLRNQSPAPDGVRLSSERVPSLLANSSLGSIIDEVFDRTTPTTPLSSRSAASETQQQQTESSKLNRQMVPVNPGVFIQQTILDLQTQLDTSRCLDIFTMNPKQCRLHFAPPTLAYSRSIRYSGEAKFKLITPFEPNRTESNPELDPRLVSGRLILITDLLIFCEYKDQLSPKSNQLALMYPPLAGKHLQAKPIHDHSTFCFDVTAMNKAVVRVHVSNLLERDAWIQHLEEAFEFGRQIVSQKQPTSTGNSLPSPIPIEEHSVEGSNSNKNKTPQSSVVSHSSITQVGANQGNQSQSISTNVSHQRSSQQQQQQQQQHHLSQQQQHHSSSSIQLAQQLSQLNLSSVSQLQSNLQKSSLPNTPTYNHPPSQIPNSNSIVPHPDHFQDSSYSHRGMSGFLGHSLSSHVSANLSEQRNSQDRPNSKQRLRKAPSAQALGAHNSMLTATHPPMPMPMRPGPIDSFDPRMAGSSSMISIQSDPIARSTSTEPYRDRHYRPPSAALFHKAQSGITLRSSDLSQAHDVSVGSVVGSGGSTPESEDGLDKELAEEEKVKQESETKTALVATLKAKVFKKQSHSQWKSLGQGQIQVFSKNPGNFKQLVVFDMKNQSKIWISTIVLTDGVERVGRTGVAVDLSDQGVRTGIVYMLQLKNETSAHGLFEQLLEGSDRRPK